MTEHEFEQRLRTYYRASVDEAGPVPSELWDSVWAIPDTAPQRSGLASRRGMVILAAAAMLTALLIGSIAVGTGILRLPWLPDPALDVSTGFSSEVVTPTPCDQTLAEGLVLSVMGNGADVPPEVHVYEDGRLIREPMIEAEAWEQRRLSPEGVQRLLAAIDRTGLRDCTSVPVAGAADIDVTARTAAGVVSMRLGGAWFRVSSERETEAAAALSEQLLAHDMGIPADLWIESEWGPYAHERREVRIYQWIGNQDDHEDVRVTQWGDLVLPDGSNLTTFGTALPEVPPDVIEPRCGVVTREESGRIAAVLGEPTEFSDDQWAFRDPSQQAGGVAVDMSWLLPHEVGCQPDPRSPRAEEPQGNLIPGLRPCDYLPSLWSVHGDLPTFDDDWAACESMAGWVFVGRHPASSAEAAAIMLDQFGIGFTTDEVRGRTVFLNACDEFHGDCSPAVAISAEPLLIIIAPMPWPDEPIVPEANDRYLLAEEIIQRLDE